MSASSVGATDQLATPPAGPAPLVAEISARAGWRDVWRAVSRNRKAIVGALLLLGLHRARDLPRPDRARTTRASRRSSRRRWARPRQHLLGTTAFGQDIFSQLIWGTRLSLVIALAVGALATVLAVLVGVSAAYLGGRHDESSRCHRRVPGHPDVPADHRDRRLRARTPACCTLIVVLGVLGWSYGARQLRSQTLSLRSRDFLESARVRGERRSYMIVFEMLPTMTSLIVANFLGAALYAVLTAAGLQFIGLGDPNSESWGTMLYWAQNNEALQTGDAAVGDRARRLRRAARRLVRPAQLRVRRDQQPGAARPQAGPRAAADGRAPPSRIRSSGASRR